MQTKKIIVTFLVASLLIGILPSLIIPVSKAASSALPDKIDTAISKGLGYLNSTQATDGSWGGSFAAACTAMAVLAFENFGHLPGNLSDPYHATVEKGLDYLFTQSYAQPIGVQPAGDPDSNNNGIGIQFGYYTGYETPMALMAIVASQNESRITTAGPVGVIGRNYHDIVQDVVDWIAWAQTDSGNIYEGGWRYAANYGSSDMSVTQWPVLGLMTAELWNMTAPDWVRTELAKWLAVDQVLAGDPTSNYYYGSFMYEPYNQLFDVVDTAAGIAGLTYCGARTNDSRIIAAEGYITRDWSTSSGWRQNFGDLYAMYGIMKTMRLTRPAPTIYIADYSNVPTIEWYNGTGQYADYLVSNQQSDGHWIGPLNPEEGETGTNLDTAWGTLILEYTPVVVKYTLTIHVIDPDIITPVSNATVSAVGLESLSGNTDMNGIVVFNETQAGPYVVSASKAGYTTAVESVYLVADTNVTMQLAQTGPFKLNVNVVNSGGLPISNVLVEAGNAISYSNASGIASFELPRRSYNVTASDPDYQSASWMVDLHGNKSIALTLAYPYVFLGEIPDSHIISQPVESGYNITLLNSLATSGMDVFFDWERVGTIPAGSWQSFNFNHMPNLIVEAAMKGTSDYPNAWNKHPLPIQLVPTTGQEGGFLPEPVPYAAGSIFVIPYPPVYGQSTTIGVTLHNPFDYPLNISRIDFQVSGLTIGGYFTSVGYLSNITLQANETNSFSINWIATFGGHHCVRVVLTYSPESQTMQRNMDIEDDVLQGQTGEAKFTLTNPYQTAKKITLVVNQQLPPDWTTELDVNGFVMPNNVPYIFDVAPGAQLDVILRIKSSSAQSGQAVVDIQGYIDGLPIGGVRKTMKTSPAVLKILDWQMFEPAEFIPVPTSCNRYEAQLATDSTNCYTETFYTPDKAYVGSPVYIVAIVKEHGSLNLQIPTLEGSAQGSDAAGHPFLSISSSSGFRIDSTAGNPDWWSHSASQYIPPDEQVYLAYKITTPTWTYAKVPTLLEAIRDAILSAGIDVVGLQKDALVKATKGMNAAIGSANKVLNDRRDFVGRADYVLTLSPSGSYSVTGSPYTLKVFTHQFKINALNELIATEILAPVISLVLDATIDATTGGLGVFGNGILIGFEASVTEATTTKLKEQMADPSINYTSFVPPPTLPQWILSLQNNTAGELISAIYMYNAFINASVESTDRATGALMENSTYYALAQEAFALEYANNASAYYSVMTNLTEETIMKLYDQGCINQTAFQAGQAYISQYGLPQQVNDTLDGLGLLHYVNLTELETSLYKPINASDINLLSCLPNPGQFLLINNAVYDGYIKALANQSYINVQYSISFDQTGIGSDFPDTVVTIDGLNYSTSDLPVTLWWESNSTHSFIFRSPLVVPTSEKQYDWASTNGQSSSQLGLITVTGSGSVIGTYSAHIHDLVVTNGTADRTWVYQGFNASISVTILNKGDLAENISLTLYYNMTANKIIGAESVAVSAGQNETVVFPWNTTGVPYNRNYTITAFASILTDNMKNDTLACGAIAVRILGDVNGDGIVNMKDVASAVSAFNSWPGKSRWNPDCDLDLNRIVNMRDIVAIVMNFNRS
jgi:hypothetical protein